MALVLGAAFLDALMHCLVRGHPDSLMLARVTAICGGLLALPLLGLAGLPDPAAWPWLGLSVVLGCAYWTVLGLSYRAGGLVLVLPLTRGVAVILTTIAATLLLGEVPGPLTGVTILCVAGGLVLLAFVPGEARLTPGGLMVTLLLAVITSAYTLVDAVGVRLAGDALAYGAVLYIGNGLGIAAFVAMNPRRQVGGLDRAGLVRGVGAAALSLGSYLLVLEAMTRAPVAPVAALAETSIVFAVVLGALLLRERARPPQILGIGLITLGVAVLRLTA